MRLVGSLLLPLFASIVLAQVAAPAKQLSDAATENSELKQLFMDDQHDRGNDPFPIFDDHGKRVKGRQWKMEPAAILVKHDADRRSRVHKILGEGKVQSGQDYWFAAMIYQHGEASDDYLIAHVLAGAAVAKGNRNGLWLAAASLDRYLLSVRQKQIYGTQFGIDKKGPWTQSDYDKDLLSDSLRTLFCVTPYEQQQQQIKAAENGRPLDANSTSISCLQDGAESTHD